MHMYYVCYLSATVYGSSVAVQRAWFMVYGSHMHVRIPRAGEQSGCRDRDRAVLLRFGIGLRGAPVFLSTLSYTWTARTPLDIRGAQ